MVDPRPGRAVHYPDLNACLVNEGRPEPVDCNTVHFGYAIPVSIVPLPEKPELAELVLDPTPDLTPEAVSYLLRHHPQLRQENNDNQGNHDFNGGNANIKMAATAKHEHVRNRNGGKFPAEPEEDIAAIAKQISDHAEAIYQTWKSRGLAPTEILTCHSNVTAADKFGSALTPQSSQTSPHQPQLSPIKSALQAKSSPSKTATKSYTTKTSQKTSPVTVDLLSSAPSLDANNLEQLVNNFVVEDKARLAAARQQQKSSPSKPLPSSIQFALQKFEKQAPSNILSGSKPSPSSPFVKPAGPHVEMKPLSSQKKSSTIGTYASHVNRSPAASALSSKSQQLTPSIKSSTPVHRHSSVQINTIETTLPQDLQQQTKRSPTESTSEAITSPSPSSSGLTTWPLKNKSVIVSGGNDRRSTGVAVNSSGSDVSNNRKDHAVSSNEKYATLPSNKASGITKNAVAYLDEVAREEERLINALKTGIVIAEDPTEATTTGNPISEKTSGLLQKKSSTKDNKAKKIKKQQATDIVTQTFPMAVTGAQTRQSPEASSTASTFPSTAVVTISAPLAQSFISPPVSKLSSPTDPDASKSQTTQQLPIPSSRDELDKSSLSSLSVVDYAKVRYRAAQQNPLTQQRLEDVKQFEQQRSIAGIASVSGTSVDSKHLHRNEVIPVARNRFQVSPRSTSTENSSSLASSAENWLPGSHVGADDEAPHAKRRIGPSTTNLARPVRHPHVDSHPPHQENTIQQRPRITGTVSGTNPVRPFLTRGSVAERVLIFEKCPSELLLEKRSRGAPAITTWRSGHDVHTKAQVRNVSDCMHATRCLSFII
jgi:serine/threonine-protein phosphatase 2A regulatory subunit B''